MKLSFDDRVEVKNVVLPTCSNIGEEITEDVENELSDNAGDENE